MMKPNWRAYWSRKEPANVKDGSDYIDLRTCSDLSRLRRLEQILQAHGSDTTLVSWISPPFGVIKGYGIYSRLDAARLAQRAEKEFWGYPSVGQQYNIAWFQRRIRRLSENYDLASR